MGKLLSICMIVKDEQEVLERCLKSISTLADEIIIIDTGSTDRTKEIAKQYTEHVYDFKWCNDFSAARNESLKYATSKWVLVLDADEYIEIKEVPSIREFLQEETPLSNTIYVVSVFSFLGENIRKGKITEGAVGRLIPNHFGIRFDRPIHEQFRSQEGLPLFSKKAAINIFHTGYLDETMSTKDKSSRNKQIFNQLKSKSGFTSYDYFTIGNEYSMQNDFKKALYYYEKAYKKTDPSTIWHYLCVFEIINNYLRLDRVNEAWELLEKENRDKHHYPDYHCMKGIIYEFLGLFELAKQSFKTAITKSEALATKEPIFWLVNPAFALEIPLTKLVTISMTEHNVQETTYYLTKKVQSDPTDYASLVQLLELTLNYQDDVAVKKFIELLFPNAKLEDYYLLFKVFLTLGQLDLASTYYNLVPNKDLFSLHDTLRFAILCEKKVMFEEILKERKIKLVDKDVLHVLALANLIWNIEIDTSLLIDKDDDPLRTNNQFYQELISKKFTNEWIELNQAQLFQLITDLFQLGQYDIFDTYITKFTNPSMIDLLANYFYSKHKYDIAISYYNNLLNSNELSFLSYINLASIHVNDELYEDAIPFYEEAIKISPNSRHLYIQLLIHCKDQDIKKQYWKQLFDRFPQYRKLSFLQSLF
ncbi:glycosyltransferase family 2 protein [Paenibacillus paridis]|uniref:tetratricopeptide repeat-containing glycosyltransferase family 2 protein n=1 Tax=Paenibacillus paridis TaxID=2583376 RepID=UPI0011201D9E|nr:glycosyltransferase family 2 protein [Paenibacillus paridis]